MVEGINLGRELRAWSLVEKTLGKYLSDKLRNGESIQISASNGHIYEIDPVTEELTCVTKRESYCVHPEDTMNYPLGDKIILYWTFLHHKPERIEEVVGPMSAGHRTPIAYREPIRRLGRSRVRHGRRVRPWRGRRSRIRHHPGMRRSGPFGHLMAGIEDMMDGHRENIRDVTDGIMDSNILVGLGTGLDIDNPQTLLSLLPDELTNLMSNILSDLGILYMNGDIELNYSGGN